jgi:hypothetical protein
MALAEIGLGRWMQVGDAAGGEAIDNHDLLTLCNVQTNDMRRDEPCASRHECFHGVRLDVAIRVRG